MHNMIVFSDLDGTLLNHHDYSYAAAKPALQRLADLNIPLILCSSKTAVEMLALQQELSLTFPFICENGALIVAPSSLNSLKDFMHADSRQRADHHYYTIGQTLDAILAVLTLLKADYQFLGFSDMSVADVIEHTGLAPLAAQHALQRLASEPLLWQDDEAKLPSFTAALAEKGLSLLKGGRFYHVMGNANKGTAATLLCDYYRSTLGVEELISLGLGDSPNDLDMLNIVTVPIIIPAASGKILSLESTQSAVYAQAAGAAGWNESVLHVLTQYGL